MEFKISIALHIIGLVMWLGGLMILTRFFKLFTVEGGAGTAGTAALIRRVFFGYAVPGLIIALGTGLYQLFYRGFSFYMSQGWFHGKLTVILLLLVVTTLAYGDLKRILSGGTLSRGRVGALHGLIGLGLLGGVFLTILGRTAL